MANTKNGPNPVTLAKAMLRSSAKLVRIDGEFFQYEGGHYQRLHDEDIHHQAFDYVRSTMGDMWATPQLIENIVKSLVQSRFIKSRTQPFWLDNRTGRFISMANGVLNVDAALQGAAAALTPSTDQFFTQSTLPFDYDPAAKSLEFESFVAWMAGGDNVMRMLQEFAGSTLIPHFRHEQMLWLTGGGGNGKSTFLEAIQNTLGAASTSCVMLPGFSSRFMLSSTIGKLANFDYDVKDSSKAAESVLRAYCSGNPISQDRKGKDPIYFTPTARLFFACNKFPHIHDRTRGFWRRLLLVNCVQEPRTVDINLSETFKASCAGIFNWLLDGCRRLLERGRLEIPQSVQDTVACMRLGANPTQVFFDECVVFVPEWSGGIPRQELFDAYCDWCQRNRYHGLNHGNFKAEVQRAFPGTRESRLGPRGNTRYWAWEKLRLRNSGDDAADDWAADEAGSCVEPTGIHIQDPATMEFLTT